MPVAVLITPCELGFDHLHAAESDGEEHQRGAQPKADARDESEQRDADACQHDDAVIHPAQLPADAEQPTAQQVDACEEQDPGGQRNRHQRHEPRAEQRAQAHDAGGDDSGQPRVGTEQVAEPR